jgi:hypothetical protein
MARLTEALELWRGAVLEEVDHGSWADGDRARLQELRRVAEEDLIDAGLVAGRHDVAVADAERAVATEPLRERRWSQLMLALYRSGRQADALNTYRRCRQTLIDELGVEPGVELRGLEQAILEQSSALDLPQDVPAVAVTPSVPAPLAEAARSPLVGRRDLLAELDRAWRRAVDGHRGTTLLLGEPGVGKTRLAAALAERALADGGSVLCGRCLPELDLPFQPFAEALSELTAMPGAQDQYELFEATTRLLAGILRQGPVLLVVEDLHWAMPPTLRMLRYIAQASALGGLLVLGTLRDTEMAVTDIGELAGVRSLVVGPMTVEEVQELPAVRAFQDPRAVARLHELAGGNPFLVEQLVLDEQEADMSSSTAARRRGFDVVGSRLGKLQPGTRAVLELAAVSGTEFDLSLLTAAHPDGQEAVLDALDEAESAGLLVASAGNRGRFSFRHAVLRSALTDNLPASRRMRLHRSLALALETGAAFDPSRTGALARHYVEAAPLGFGKHAVDYARRAGELARRGYAYEEAAQYFTLALEAMTFSDPADDGLRCDLLTARGEAIRAGGDTRGVDLLQAAQLARSVDDPERLAAVVLAMAGASHLMEPVGGNIGLTALAEEAAAALHDRPPLRARMLAVLISQLAPWTEHDERRRVVTADTLELARSCDDPGVLLTVLIACLSGWSDPWDVAGRLAMAKEAAELADRLGDPEPAYRAHHLLAMALMVSGDIEGYTTTRMHVRQLATVLQQPSAHAAALLADAADRFLAGDLEAVERLTDEAEQISVRSGMPPRIVGAIRSASLGPARLLQGRLGEFREPLDAISAVWPMSAWRFCRPLMHLELGNRDVAQAEFDEIAAAGFTDVPRRATWTLLMAFVAQTAIALEDRDRAAVLIDRLHPLSGTVVSYEACHFDLVDRLLGALHTVVGNHETAADLLRRAEAQSRILGAPLFLAHTQVELARVAAAVGDPAEARRLAASASATAERLGAHAIVREASAVTAVLGDTDAIPGVPSLAAQT